MTDVALPPAASRTERLPCSFHLCMHLAVVLDLLYALLIAADAKLLAINHVADGTYKAFFFFFPKLRDSSLVTKCSLTSLYTIYHRFPFVEAQN